MRSLSVLLMSKGRGGNDLLEFDEDGEMIEMDDAAVEEAIRQAMLESSDDDETGTDPEVEEKPE